MLLVQNYTYIYHVHIPIINVYSTYVYLKSFFKELSNRW